MYSSSSREVQSRDDDFCIIIRMRPGGAACETQNPPSQWYVQCACALPPRLYPLAVLGPLLPLLLPHHLLLYRVVLHFVFTANDAVSAWVGHLLLMACAHPVPASPALARAAAGSACWLPAGGLAGCGGPALRGRSSSGAQDVLPGTEDANDCTKQTKREKGRNKGKGRGTKEIMKES